MKKTSLAFLFSISLLGAFCCFSQSLRDKIGQMIIVGFDQNSSFMDTLWVDISQRHLGGVIVYSQNIQNPQQIRTLTAQLQARAQTPLFICVDQEGGRVARLNANNGFAATPTAFHLGTIVDREDTTRVVAATMANWLQQCGINMNLAPVVDVNVNPSSPAIGFYGRSFSANPLTVARHAGWFIDEFNRRHILCTLKHFPGHGSAMMDSHLGFTDITTTWADSELVPYRKLIAAGFSDLIMVGHLFNAKWDAEYPASLSYKVVTERLRQTLGFNGLIISDEMSMGAIANNYPFESAIELAIRAGVDILLFRSNVRNGLSLVRQVIDCIERQVANGSLASERIEQSYARIAQFKKRLTNFPLPPDHPLPDDFALSNFPNPFSHRTMIAIALPKPTVAKLSLFTITGQLVWQNRKTPYPAGHTEIELPIEHLPVGIYLLTFEGNDRRMVRKMTLIR